MSRWPCSFSDLSFQANHGSPIHPSPDQPVFSFIVSSSTPGFHYFSLTIMQICSTSHQLCTRFALCCVNMVLSTSILPRITTEAQGNLTIAAVSVKPLIARFMGPTWAHLGPIGPRWAPCWPHELCYLGRNYEEYAYIDLNGLDSHNNQNETVCIFNGMYCGCVIRLKRLYWPAYQHSTYRYVS